MAFMANALPLHPSEMAGLADAASQRLPTSARSARIARRGPAMTILFVSSILYVMPGVTGAKLLALVLLVMAGLDPAISETAETGTVS
jgi:hypothetical protein